MSRLASFPFAVHGIGRLLKEPNARIHLIATLVVVWAAAVLHVTPLEWIALVCRNQGQASQDSAGDTARRHPAT